MSTYAEKYDWAAFIDVDEFILLKKHKTIASLLSEYRECQAICVNWKLFGSSGHKESSKEPVLSRFVHSEAGVNPHIKTIVNLKLLRSFGNLS